MSGWHVEATAEDGAVATERASELETAERLAASYVESGHAVTITGPDGVAVPYSAPHDVVIAGNEPAGTATGTES